MERRLIGSAASLLVALLGVLSVGLVPAGPAVADDSTDPDNSTGSPYDNPYDDPFADPTATVSVEPPTQEQIDDAKEALERAGRADPAEGDGPAGDGTFPVAATADVDDGGVSDAVWWVVGAAALVLLVGSEVYRLDNRRRTRSRSEP